MTEFKGRLGHYRVITTGDHSPTLWSEFFDENCHSTHGAYAETLENYVRSCEINTRCQGDFNILEVGFGLGMGLKVTLENIPQERSGILTFVSLELDEALVEWAIQNLVIEHYDLTQLQRRGQHYEAIYPAQKVRVIVLIGDARTTLPQQSWRFHAIYQDPFSPKKNPSLWTQEWFELLRQCSDDDCIMATYSASVGVRKAMLEAGWHPESLPGFGPKRERTLARLYGPGDEKLERRLRASAAPCLRDKPL